MDRNKGSKGKGSARECHKGSEECHEEYDGNDTKGVEGECHEGNDTKGVEGECHEGNGRVPEGSATLTVRRGRGTQPD